MTGSPCTVRAIQVIYNLIVDYLNIVCTLYR